jgi:hypothetical protein
MSQDTTVRRSRYRAPLLIQNQPTRSAKSSRKADKVLTFTPQTRTEWDRITRLWVEGRIDFEDARRRCQELRERM